MQFTKVALASFLALSLVACGDSDDTSKPDDGKTQVPEKDQACIDAGDLCKLENGKWVVHKKDEDKKPDDVAPVADGSFDYSNIGVTDKLLPERRGFGFWHKGAKSPLDVEKFKNKVTLAPIISWTSDREYDEDLYNFVAIKLTDKDNPDEEFPVKFMFDKIGIQNQLNNPNNEFFGKGKEAVGGKDFDSNTGADNQVGKSSLKVESQVAAGWKVSYAWNKIPAVVNTLMGREVGGSLKYVWADPKNQYFSNQEEENTSEYGSGKKSTRVYGVNAFLEPTTNSKVINPSGHKVGTATKDHELKNRSDKYYNHINYVWYNTQNLSAKTSRNNISFFVDRSSEPEACSGQAGKDCKIYVKAALGGYINNDTGESRPFPTDVEYGTLESTQFGRLTGEGADPQTGDIYNKKNIKLYPYTASEAVIGGNKNAEDWYFARGTEPTPLSVLENYKNMGGKIAYDGQAVMFGLDYKPTTSVKKLEQKQTDQSTNSLKPAAPESIEAKMLLDGKQNFVKMIWDPATGVIEGNVYGVWTLATYWKKSENGKEKIYGIADRGQIDVGNGADMTKAQEEFEKQLGPISYKKPSDKVLGSKLEELNKDLSNIKIVAENAVALEPWIIPLVSMKGNVVEGTNSFGGRAVRVKDESKGLFAGAFFGADGKEIGGVINSQAGDYASADLADPAAKWGGAFGARYNGSVDEDLIFVDPTYRYTTSPEFWNRIK